tara:strand:+ start:85 stop:1041 length:957 start_codon:yes stop_codon:yes gene_type:complete
MLDKVNSKKISLYLASPRGFCAGVERAINMVEKALIKYGKPVYVRHEIVHNKYVVEDLKSKGAIFIDELNEVEDKTRPVIFSAHGVPKSVPQEAKYLNLQFFDATCPLVSKIHREVENFEKLELPIILIGHRNHPEVVGTMGQIKSKIYLVENVDDVDSLPISTNTKIAYVTQTTLSIDDTKSIIEKIKNNFLKVIEPKKNDICYATTNRQNAVKKIAPFCDLFLVIGASNSSNSLRLVEVANQYGAKKSVLLENLENFDYSLINNINTMGITASASAPEILLKNFISYMKINYKIDLHQSENISEDINFNIPKQLEE